MQTMMLQALSGPQAAAAALLTLPLPISEDAPLRLALSAEIDRLIEILDILDGDVDLENGYDREGDEPDREPNLASLDNPDQTRWADGGLLDAELDDSDDEESGDLEPELGDREPSLGSFDRMLNQDHAYRVTEDLAHLQGYDFEADKSDFEDGGDTEPNGDELDYSEAIAADFRIPQEPSAELVSLLRREAAETRKAATWLKSRVRTLQAREARP